MPSKDLESLFKVNDKDRTQDSQQPDNPQHAEEIELGGQVVSVSGLLADYQESGEQRDIFGNLHPG